MPMPDNWVLSTEAVNTGRQHEVDALKAFSIVMGYTDQADL